MAALTSTIVFGLIFPDAEMIEWRSLRSIRLISTSTTCFSSCAFLAWKPMPPAASTTTVSQIFVLFFTIASPDPVPRAALARRLRHGARKVHGRERRPGRDDLERGGWGRSAAD